MLRRAATRACLALALALVASACSDDNDDKGPVADAAVPTPDASLDAGVPSLDGSVGADAGADAGDGAVRAALTACLDRPDELPRPPVGELPCELLPPGLSLPR